ncbi:MAG: patatin-like phospholipase family protein, partial [Saprospiraceae bacterium]
MPDKYKLYKARDVIKEEDEHLKKRREIVFGESIDQKKLDETRFGIALSGGGIRSATINLGLLKTLNKFGILKKADYLSTVSGGGYTGAYIQSSVRADESYDRLFADEQIKYLRSRGAYLIPGEGKSKFWNTLVLAVGFLVSLTMSWLSPAIVIALIYMFYVAMTKLFSLSFFAGFQKVVGDFNALYSTPEILEYSLYGVLLIFFLHTLANLSKNYHVSISRTFNHIETAVTVVFALWMFFYFLTSLEEKSFFIRTNTLNYSLVAVLLILIGFYTNPNALSFHRFYRNQLTDAF